VRGEHLIGINGDIQFAAALDGRGACPNIRRSKVDGLYVSGFCPAEPEDGKIDFRVLYKFHNGLA